MALRRMIAKDICYSERVANLNITAQLLFTWMIVQADDLGLLPFSGRALKGTVFPLSTITQEELDSCVKEILDQGLINVFEYEGEKFYHLIKFHKFQTLKRDRNPMTICRNIKDWDTVPSVWKPRDSKVKTSYSVSEEKKSEGKGRKDNSDIAEKNSEDIMDIVDGISFPPPFDYPIEGPDEFAALEVWGKLEASNPLAFFTTYLPAAKKGISAHWIYTFCSEIEQDKKIKNPGAVFNAKVKAYLDSHSNF